MNEPTKICRKCGRKCIYEELIKNKRCIGGRDALCRKCSSIQSKKYRDNNPEKILQLNRQWRNKNREKVRGYNRRWRKDNKEKVAVLSSEWRKLNLVRFKNTQKEYYKHNKEHLREIGKIWIKENIDKYRFKHRIYQRLRKQRYIKLDNNFTEYEWEACKKFFNYCCAYCRKTDKLEMDHYIPITGVSCPGTVVGNIVPACKGCNSSKNNRDPVKWIINSFETHGAQHILCNINNYFLSLMSIGLENYEK